MKLLGNEGGVGRQQPGHGFETAEQSIVGGPLVGAVSRFPEPPAGAAHIPIRKVLDHEFLDRARAARQLVTVERVAARRNQSVEAREHPPIQERRLRWLPDRGVVAVDIRVQGEELGRVLERSEELFRDLGDPFRIEPGRGPRRTRADHVKADGVGPALVQDRVGIDHVPARLAHLLAFFVQDELIHEHVLVRRLTGDEYSDRHQRIEPSARLIHSLRYEISGIERVEAVGVLEGIVPLREGHRARVEPDVDDLRHAAGRTVAFRASEGDLIDVRAMEVERIGHPLPLPQLRDAPDAAILTAALTPPDRKGRAPVAIP